MIEDYIYQNSLKKISSRLTKAFSKKLNKLIKFKKNNNNNFRNYDNSENNVSLVVNKVSRKNNVCANYYAKDSITIISDPIPSNLRYVVFYDSFYKAFFQCYVE